MLTALLRFGIASALLSTLVGCETRPRDPAPAGTAAASAPLAPVSSAAPAGPKAFGAPITPGPELALSELLSNPEGFRDRTVTVACEVRAACTRRGCWMELAQSSDPNLP